MSVLDILSEIATHLSGGLLSGPSSISKRIFLTFLVASVSFGFSIFATYTLFANGPSYFKPEWALSLVYFAAFGGIFTFPLGFAYWAKAKEARTFSALAAVFGLAALILFPLCLHFLS